MRFSRRIVIGSLFDSESYRIYKGATMRGLTVAIILASIANTITAQDNVIDVQAMTAKYQHIVFSPSVGATLKLGAVADLSGKKFVANNAMQLKIRGGEKIDISIATSSVASRETTVSSFRELAASVEASLTFFGSGNFNLSMSNQEAEQSRQKTLYARISVIDGVRELEQVSWPANWPLPKPATVPTDRVKDFVRTFGTHYVSKLYYGRSISIKATLGETDHSRKDALEAKLRTQFLAFKLDGEFAKTAKNETKDYKFDLFIAISGGKSDRPERLLIRNFDDLNKFIEDLQAERFKFDSIPVAADFVSLSGLTKDEQIDRSLRGAIRFTDPRELPRVEPPDVLGSYKDPRNPNATATVIWDKDNIVFRITDGRGAASNWTWDAGEKLFVAENGADRAYFFREAGLLASVNAKIFWTKIK